MLRSLSAGIFGACVLGGIGCTGPAVQSRVPTLQIDPNVYVVQAGDTIESIAFRYRLTSSQLAALNPGLSSVAYQGAHLRIRSGKREITQAAVRSPRTVTRGSANQHAPVNRYEVPVENSNAGAAPQVVVTAVQQNDQVIREEIIQDGQVVLAPATTRPLSPTNAGGWHWPSAGEVVRDFAPGEVNGQGIDIAGVPGQEIHAIGSGTVIYAGRDLSNSGNLVIIRHPDDVLSTYSHTKDLFVAEDDIVKGGDPIASLGWNSNRESVLHFGIRKNGKPVNPAQYLPSR